MSPLKRVPLFGCWEMTMPSATVLEYWWETSTFSPRFLSVSSASSALLPAQLPTGIGRRPFETTRSTIVPNRSVLPALGSEAMTMPSGTVSENALVALPKAMLALRIRSCASSTVIPVSFGSCPTARPSETVIVTSVPLRTRLPADGSVLSTSPASTVSEYFGSAVSTSSPASSSRCCASSGDSCRTAGVVV